MKLKMMPDEVFLGGAVTDGIRQPYTAASTEELDLPRKALYDLALGKGTVG